MDHKANSQKARRRNGERGARETFVMVAMTLVIAALGIGLFVHFELSVGLAAGVALIAFTALLSMHLLTRRNADIAHLEAEIRELRAHLAHLQRGNPGRLPVEATAGPAPMTTATTTQELLSSTEDLAAAISASMPAPLAAAPRAPDVAPPAPLVQSAESPRTMVAPAAPQQPPAGPTPQSAASAHQSAPTAPRKDQPEVSLPASAEGKLPPPAPPIVTKAAPPLPAAPLDPDQILIVTSPAGSVVRTAAPAEPAPPHLTADMPVPSVPAPKSVPPPAVIAENLAPVAAPPPPMQVAPDATARAEATAVATTPISATKPEPVAPAPSPLAPPPSADGDALMAPYWALRPGAILQSTDSHAGASTSPSAPLSSPVPPSQPPGGPSLETMQNLIDQLSVQLNPPAPVAVPPPAPAATAAGSIPAAANDAIIQDSIAALRRTSEVMRQPPEPVASETAADRDPTAEMPPIPYSRLAIVAEAIAADRIDLCLDPILALEGRKPRHFEVSVRLRADDGLELSADDVTDDIQGTGLLARLDAAKLTRTADVAQRLERRGTGASLFANLSRESLADDSFLDTFADTFIDREPLCSRLVLAFAQRDVRDFGDAHWDAISTMAELGFRFALEHVTDLDMDFEDLRAQGFEFVKLDAEVFLRGMQAGDTNVPSSDICRHMADVGLGLIVGGIAHERDLARIMGFGVVFGQGTLFGAPRSVTLERTAA